MGEVKEITFEQLVAFYPADAAKNTIMLHPIQLSAAATVAPLPALLANFYLNVYITGHFKSSTPG